MSSNFLLVLISLLTSHFIVKCAISGKKRAKIVSFMVAFILYSTEISDTFSNTNLFVFQQVCKDKEEWCSFANPDCNQGRVRASCPKTCNMCIGKFLTKD